MYKDVIKEARIFHEEHKMKIGRDYRLEFLKLSKEDIYDFLETKYGDYIHVWRQKLWESENRERELQKKKEDMHLNMQYYMEHCQAKGYVTPQEWIEKHKHF